MKKICIILLSLTLTNLLNAQSTDYYYLNGPAGSIINTPATFAGFASNNEPLLTSISTNYQTTSFIPCGPCSPIYYETVSVNAGYGVLINPVANTTITGTSITGIATSVTGTFVYKRMARVYSEALQSITTAGISIFNASRTDFGANTQYLKNSSYKQIMSLNTFGLTVIPAFTVPNGFACNYCGYNGDYIIETRNIVVENLVYTDKTICRNQTIDLTSLTTISGVTFTGDAIINNIFYPDLAVNNVTAASINKNYVNGLKTVNFNINRIDTVIQGLFANAPGVCGSAKSFDLNNAVKSGFQNSGTFTGFNTVSGKNIITGSILNITLAGAGTFNFSYLYNNSVTGCKTLNYNQVTINPVLTVTAGPNQMVCQNINQIDFTGNFPLGGVFTGTGISGNTFTFGSVLTGNYSFGYLVQDNLGCQYGATKTVSVMGSNFIKKNGGNGMFSSSPILCANEILDLTSTLNAAYLNPLGIFNSTVSPLITGNLMDANQLGSSVLRYWYTFVDTIDGCNLKDGNTAVINPGVVVEFFGISPVCVNSDLNLITGVPQGGVYSGVGVKDPAGLFNSSVPGLITLNYAYTNTDNCVYAQSTVITVNSAPVISPGYTVSICGNAVAINLKDVSVLPKYGTFTGIGIVNGFFDPTKYAPSPTINTIGITYSATSSVTGCTNTSNRQIIILPVPSTTGIAASSHVCDFGSVTISVSNPNLGYKYSFFDLKGDLLPIYTGSSFNTPSLSAKRNYYFNVTNNYNCLSAKDSIRADVGLTDANVTLNDTSIAINSGIIDLSTFYNKPNVTVLGVNGLTIANNQLNTKNSSVGKIAVTYLYFNLDNCLSSAKQNLNLIKGTTTGIAGLLNSEILVYPNPSESIFNIENLSGLQFNYTVLDLIGNTVATGHLNERKELHTINIPGIYFLKLSYEKESLFLKLIKK